MPKSRAIPFEEQTEEEKEITRQGGQVTENTRKVREKLAPVIEESKKEIQNVPSGEKTQEELLKEEEQKDKTRLNHQAFLMFNWESITQESRSKSERFKYFAQIEHNEPAEINNIMFKKPIEYDILLNSKSAYLSYFVPKIRIFKEYAVSATEVIDVELPIQQQYREIDFDSIFKNKEGRGGGVGIKSLNWNTIGNSQGNKFSFGAEIELFFESIGEISKVRSINTIGGKTIETSFEDLLIAKMGPRRNPEGAVYDPNYYRVKAEIGWSIPPNNANFVPQEMIEEIKYSNLSLYMTLHSHEIDIGDDSTVILKLKYIAYIEALSDSPKNSNVFYPAVDGFQEQIDSDRQEIDKIAGQLKGDEDKGVEPLDGTAKKNAEESINNIEEKIKNQQNNNKIQVYQRILSYIYGKQMIKYLIAKQEDVQKFTSIISRPKNSMSSKEQIDAYNREIDSIRQNNAKMAAGGGFPAGTQFAVGNVKPEEVTNSFSTSTQQWNEALKNAAKTENGEIPIPYFHLGDLIDAILEKMYNGDKDVIKGFFEKEIKVLLGPVIFYDYGRLTDSITLKAGSENKINSDGSATQVKTYTGAKTVINIADIPISLDVYTAWFTKKIIDAGVTNMSLKDFISNIINDLVVRAVGVETYSFAPRQKTRLVYKTKTLRRSASRLFGNTSSGDSSAASFSTAISTGQTSIPNSLRFPATSLKLYESLPVVEDRSSLDNFMLLYSVSDQQFELVSDYDMDKKRGIRHIVYGAETGLIKTIKFSRQDNPMLRSHNMRMASQQNPDKSVILREVYNANVEMFGNSLFEIGELIYVSPTLFGSNTSVNFVKNLGIGGYFMILKIQNSITDGSFKTSLDLKWNAKGDGIPVNLNDGISGGVKII
jgi:hypothetical protein